MRFNAQKLEFSPFSRSKSENETQENAKHAKNGVLFLRVSGSQSRFPIVGFKRVFFKFLSAWAENFFCLMHALRYELDIHCQTRIANVPGIETNGQNDMVANQRKNFE